MKLQNIEKNVLSEFVETGRLAGAVTLVWRAGAVVDLAAVGCRHLVRGLPVERDTIFRIASMTKPITTVAALLLLDEGRFALDEPITTCAPELTHLRVLRHPEGPLDETDEAARPMTFRDLLTHRSGLTYGELHRGRLGAAYSDTLGPTIDNALTRYLSMPFVPSALGFDPRLQLLHEDDAIEVLRLATVAARPGVVNVAADGVLTLSQLLRQTGRVRVPVPRPAVGLVGMLVRNSGVLEVTAEESRYLCFGRVVDTTRLHTGFGYTPRYTTAETVRAYAADRPSRLGPGRIGRSVGSRVLPARPEGRRPAITRN